MANVLSNQNNNSNYKNNLVKLIVFSMLIFIGILIRDVAGVPINKYIFIFIVTLAYYFLSEGFMVAFIAFLIPFLPGLPANYIIGAAIPFILLKQKNITINVFVGAAYAFLFIQLSHLYTHPSSIGEFIRFSIYIILMTMILLRRDRNYDNRIILFFYGLGVIASYTSILINTIKYKPLDSLLKEGVRIGNLSSVNQQFDGSNIILSLDQNTLGYFCAIAISAFLILLYSKSIHPILAVILIFITFMYGCLTLSRTFALIAVGSFFYYFFINLRTNKHSIKTNLILFVTSVLTILIIVNFIPNTLDMLINRFQERDITNGRTEIFAQYNQFMFSSAKNFTVGIGLQFMNVKANILYNPHNGLQQIFVAGGIVGFLFFFIWMIGMFVKNRPSDKKNIRFYVLPLLTLIVYIQGLQFLSPFVIMLPLIVVFAALRLPDNLPESQNI